MSFYAVTFTQFNGEIKDPSPYTSFDASFDDADESIEYVNKQAEEFGPKYLSDHSEYKITVKADHWTMVSEIRSGKIIYIWTIMATKLPVFYRFSSQRRSELEQSDLSLGVNGRIRQIWTEWASMSPAEKRAWEK